MIVPFQLSYILIFLEKIILFCKSNINPLPKREWFLTYSRNYKQMLYLKRRIELLDTSTPKIINKLFEETSLLQYAKL